eukprot:SAG11_NODE_33315_length_278_cov_0.575419_1_plen_21_part_10
MAAARPDGWTEDNYPIARTRV